LRARRNQDSVCDVAPGKENDLVALSKAFEHFCIDPVVLADRQKRLPGTTVLNFVRGVQN
jgi:hypothetical protein